MNRRQRRAVAVLAVMATMAWLACGTLLFVMWQVVDSGWATNTGQFWEQALLAAALVALVFWVLAGIAYGVIRWIVTGRGPQA